MPAPALTPRELEIARLVRDGLTRDSVCALLHISPNTFGRHMAAVNEKAGARNATHAIWLLRRELE